VRVVFNGASSGIGSCAGTACALVVLFDVRRENWKPSSSSSYAALAAFFVAPVALLVVPFTSVLGRFDVGAGASSSSKACFTLLRRVEGRLAAMGSDSKGERAKMVVMGPVAVVVVSVDVRRLVQSACIGATTEVQRAHSAATYVQCSEFVGFVKILAITRIVVEWTR
jgi:hypothetical protein